MRVLRRMSWRRMRRSIGGLAGGWASVYGVGVVAGSGYGLAGLDLRSRRPKRKRMRVKKTGSARFEVWFGDWRACLGFGLYLSVGCGGWCLWIWFVGSEVLLGISGVVADGIGGNCSLPSGNVGEPDAPLSTPSLGLPLEIAVDVDGTRDPVLN